MHDNQGRELKRGDLVLVPMIIDQVHPFPDYCNITLRSVQGRKPDGYKEVLTGNAFVVFRANAGDVNEHEALFNGSEELVQQYQPVPVEEPETTE